MNDDQTDTQLLDDVDQDALDVDSGTQDDGTQGDDEPFLVINDRTKYMTREEAVKAFGESGNRISELSAWEKEVAKPYGIKDPRQLSGILNEYLAMKRAALANAGKGAQKTAADAAATHSDDGLSAEEKQGLAWLKKMLPHLGLSPEAQKATVEKLEKQLTELGDFKKSSDERAFNSLVESGRSTLKSLMTAAKLPTSDADYMTDVENFITAHIDADDERVAAFYKGGAALEEVVTAAFERFKKVMGIATGKAASAYAKDKNNALVRNGRPAPRGPGALRPGAQPAAKAAPVKKGITPDVHNKAFERATAAWRGASADAE